MFPNQFNVYLHDTPARSLFTKSRRAFSHGCVRLEKPVELATYVLRDDPHWSRNRLLAAMTSGVRRAVRLPAPLPIHLVYRTAWVETDGAVHFRVDLYGHDTPSGFCGSTSCGIVDGMWCSSEDHTTIVRPPTGFDSGH
jgi:murein L,D-transpeptidase YcbB/YkuD